MNARVPMLGEIPAPKTMGVAILRKGFRPFFLLAAASAVAILPVWMLILAGVGGLAVDRQLGEATWHAHELLFGFSAAVIAGFLLTAVGNWTGRETATGPWLAALVGVWLAGRIAVIVPLPHPIAELVDLAFIPALGIAIGRPLVQARNRRNFVMLGVLAVYWLSDVAVWSVEWRTRGLRMAVDVVVLLIVILGGRVIPMFTRNATGVESIRAVPALDGLAAGSMALVTIADAAIASAYVRASLSTLAALFVAARTVHWGTRHTLRVPLVWILHAGHAFIAIGLLMRALPVVLPIVSASAATHAFTVGAIGCMTLGMMSRVALGHTGRMLEVRRPIAIAFALLALAGVVRVVGPTWRITYTPSLFIAGTLWTLAFGTFLVVYAPILFSPRTDGKPG